MFNHLKPNLFAFALLIILVSCKSKNVQQRNAFIKINNTNIVYDVCGSGDTTILFLHGWGINKEYWSNQTIYFCDRYKVITMDLPGFGQSGKERTEWNFEKFTDDIHDFIREKKLKNVVLVGHSMSGDILLLMDTKYPDAIIGIVGIDNLHTPGVKNTELQTREINQFFAMMDSSFSGTAEMYTRNYLFPKGADSNIVKRVANDIKSNDSAIAIKVLRSLADISQREKEMMVELNHKLYLVNSDVNTTQIDSLKKYCKVSAAVEYVKGTGHYPMIENPAEFNGALEKVIRDIGN